MRNSLLVLGGTLLAFSLMGFACNEGASSNKNDANKTVNENDRCFEIGGFAIDKETGSAVQCFTAKGDLVARWHFVRD